MNDEKRSWRVIGISGSLRPQSHTRRAVEAALAGAAAAGAQVEFVDLRTFALPFCPGSASALADYPDVARLRKIIQQADAAILGSPEYHGSFSGVLKNAIDVTELEDWQGRLIALVGISGGSQGPAGALSGLRDVGRGLHAWVLPQQVAIAAAHKAFDEHGQLHEEVRQRLEKLGRQTVEALSHLRHRSH